MMRFTMAALLMGSVISAQVPTGYMGSPNLEKGLKGRSDVLVFLDFESADWHKAIGITTTAYNTEVDCSVVFQGKGSLKVTAR